MNRKIEQLEALIAVCTEKAERAGLLHELGMAVRFIDPARARELARQSVELARACGHPVMEANALMLIGAVSLPMSEFEAARASLEQAIAISEELGDEPLRARAQGRMVSYHHWIGNPTAAIDLANRCIPALERHKAYDVLVGVLLTIAGSHAQRSEFSVTFEILVRAAEICEANGFEKELATVYSSMGECSASMGECRNALGFLEKSLIMNRKLGNLFGQGTCRHLLGNCYVVLHEHEAAIEHLNEAMLIFRELGVKKLEVGALDTLGLVFLDQGDKDKALECFRNSLAESQKIEGAFLPGYSLNNIAAVMIERGESELAEQYLSEALSHAEDSGDVHLRSMVYEVMAKLYENRGMLDRALECYKRYAGTKIEWLEADTRMRIAGMQSQFQVQMLEKERAIQDLETERLRQEMEHRNRELTVVALQLVEKSERVRKLKEQLRELPTGDSGSLASALRKIEGELGSENDWEHFSRQFAHIHPGFAERLLKRYPALTQTEVRICTLARINLSIKEMANLLSIEVRSVEVYRNRLRKKLGLTQKDSLVSFIITI